MKIRQFLTIVACFLFIVSSATFSTVQIIQWLNPKKSPIVYEGYDEQPCKEVELPTWCSIGTDATCQACGQYMLKLIEDNNYNCILITNKGYIPTAKNPVTHGYAKILASGY